MFQLSTYLVGIVFILVNTIHAQGDPPLCADTSSLPQDSKWRTIPPRFEITAELVSDNNVIELSQAFSPTRDSLAYSLTGGNLVFDIIFLLILKFLFFF